MIIGIPKEIKNNENRVGLTPAGVLAFKQAGHDVWVEKEAGVGSGFSDEDYLAQGADIKQTAKETWAADMVIKVKEPLASEYVYFRPDLLLFTYLHLAPAPELTNALLDGGLAAVAYETVVDRGTLPLLNPMSEVAGRMATQLGARYLTKIEGGAGILLGGVPGVKKGRVVIIGGGNVGANAAQMAVGLGADVTILDVNPTRLAQLDTQFDGKVQTLMSNTLNITEAVAEADLLIGAVLIPGARAPKLVTKEMVSTMKPGSVIIDVAVDQGGIIETADRVTTHDAPTYVVDGVIHYAVANMPGAVARTSTLALTNATLPYALELANKGLETAIAENPALRSGLNIYHGKVTNEAVAQAHDLPYHAV
ncbi:alanine dehydrogenase [Streptococcus thoraltensis]|uniref:alanine dehydrogenase n=1 Tax=Streptococcus thoraltensis TaxID=55085 RepID=UPI000374E6AB|nr:alanine dehydrogenase [Streptococcus thoraltensis]MDY4760946.1 alanine dehydrogenase [Streptococcus thoraltensis]